MPTRCQLKYLLRDITAFRRPIVVVLAPLLLLIIPIVWPIKEAKCAYVVLLMAVFWMTEALPLAVTSFFPVFLYPLFGVLDVKTVCYNYLKDTNFVFLGGLILAVAVEESGLHKRMALKVLLFMGSQPRWLMLGFMITTAFLSMWMSNTATTAMMLPIATAVTDELMKHNHMTRQASSASLLKSNRSVPDVKFVVSSTEGDEESNVNVESQSLVVSPSRDHMVSANGTLVVPIPLRDLAQRNILAAGRELYQKQLEEQQPTHHHYFSISPVPSTQNMYYPEMRSQFSTIGIQADLQKEIETAKEEMPDYNTIPYAEQRIYTGLFISLCYSANIGGTGTLTGTGPNLVLAGVLETLYKRKDTGITFASWIEFAFPQVVVILFFSWCWLQILFLGWRNFFSFGKARNSDDSVTNVLRGKYNELGPMSFAEKSVSFWFSLLVILWIMRDPKFLPGWGELFTPGFTSDSVAAMFVATMLFVWPKEMPDFLCCRKDKSAKPSRRASLMTWSAMQKKFPWGIVLLLGGGFAMANGVEKSGLSDLLSSKLSRLSHWPLLAVLAVCILSVVFVTEFSSNVATASIFVPLVLSVAENMCINPLYLALPVTLSASFAFMLPVSTPPNAIVFGCGRMKVMDMVTAGIMMHVISISVTMLNINTFAYWLFDLSKFPNWADDHLNGTCF